MSSQIAERLRLTCTFLRAARRYWLGVFPHVRAEVRNWRGRGQLIPDPVLRRIALRMQAGKRGNVEGAAAYAAFARLPARSAVSRAQVSFQTAYDYVDMLSEGTSSDPVANGRQLHRALLSAAEMDAPARDYYEHCPLRCDGGYLRALRLCCRESLGTLPSLAVVAAALRRAIARIVDYQGCNHHHPEGMHLALARWAIRQTPAGTDLRWWETAASAGSSTGIFSMMAAASEPELTPRRARALEGAYFPWAGTVHTLLDSLVDRAEDAAAGQPNLLDYYGCAQEAAARMGAIAAEAASRMRGLADGRDQVTVFAAMTSFYVSTLEGKRSGDRAIATAVIGSVGGPVVPSLLVFAARGSLSRIARQGVCAGTARRPGPARRRSSFRPSQTTRRLRGGARG